jgi:hypothetical protein
MNEGPQRGARVPLDCVDVCPASDWDGWQHAPVCPIGGVRDDDRLTRLLAADG